MNDRRQLASAFFFFVCSLWKYISESLNRAQQRLSDLCRVVRNSKVHGYAPVPHMMEALGVFSTAFQNTRPTM
jgi:hypothetical protein